MSHFVRMISVGLSIAACACTKGEVRGKSNFAGPADSVAFNRSALSAAGLVAVAGAKWDGVGAPYVPAPGTPGATVALNDRAVDAGSTDWVPYVQWKPGQPPIEVQVSGEWRAAPRPNASEGWVAAGGDMNDQFIPADFGKYVGRMTLLYTFGHADPRTSEVTYYGPFAQPDIQTGEKQFLVTVPHQDPPAGKIVLLFAKAADTAKGYTAHQSKAGNPLRITSNLAPRGGNGRPGVVPFPDLTPRFGPDRNAPVPDAAAVFLVDVQQGGWVFISSHSERRNGATVMVQNPNSGTADVQPYASYAPKLRRAAATGAQYDTTVAHPLQPGQYYVAAWTFDYVTYTSGTWRQLTRAQDVGGKSDALGNQWNRVFRFDDARPGDGPAQCDHNDVVIWMSWGRGEPRRPANMTRVPMLEDDENERWPC